MRGLYCEVCQSNFDKSRDTLLLSIMPGSQSALSLRSRALHYTIVLLYDDLLAQQWRPREVGLEVVV